jgi:hypothetical protein
MKIKLGDFAEAISTRIWDAVGRANWRSFEDARAFVHSLTLKSTAEWYEYCESDGFPPDIPSNPQLVYADKGWIGIGDWLGTGRVATQFRRYRSFREARNYVRKLKLKGEQQWREYKKRLPHDIPAKPEHVYASRGWQGWGDWLGTGQIAHQLRKYRSFKKARA